jgi:tetratricopeptide (TPR) repeat protein
MSTQPKTAVSPPTGETPAGDRRRRVWRALLLGTLSTLVVSAGVAWWFVVPRLRSARARDAARTALAADDFPAARQTLQVWRELSPNDPDVYVDLARLEERVGDFQKALARLQEARHVGLPSQKMEFEQLLAQALGGGVAVVAPRLQAVAKGNTAEAGLAYEFLTRGWILVGAVSQAHLVCDAWVARFPDDWRGHYWLGWVLESEGYHAFAAEEYRRAHEANPRNFDARFRLAETLVNMSDYPPALPLLDACVTARPDDPAVRYARARCLQALGRNDEAESTLQKLVAQNPQHGPALLLLARLLLGREDAKDAVDFAQRAARLDPTNPVPAATLAEALRGVQSDKEAAAWEDKARTLTEQNERIANLAKAAKYNPRDVETRYQLGTLLVGLGRVDEGVRWLRAGLAIDPNHVPTRQALAKFGPPGRSPAERPGAATTQPTSP